MSELRKQKQAAIEAVARHFSATWEGGEEPADAYVTIAAKRVAVEVVTIKRVGNRRGDAKPRLRFDRVALRLVGGLQAALHGSVPDGKTVLVTITAPIRLAAKTAAALEDQIRSHLAHRSAQREVKYRIHGNHVRVRFVEGHVVVGTPGRLIDHLDRGSLDLSNIRMVVLDEADEMLKMGFIEDMEKILS